MPPQTAAVTAETDKLSPGSSCIAGDDFFDLFNKFIGLVRFWPGWHGGCNSYWQEEQETE